MTAASKVARISDLIAFYLIRFSQFLSSGAKRRAPVKQNLRLGLPASTPEEFIQNAGDFLQHTGSIQKEYGHGELLYRLVTDRCLDLGKNHGVNILEIGTARGFSSLVMAKALEDFGGFGIVLTVDIVRHDTPTFPVNQLGKTVRFSREELLQVWRKLVEKRVIFLGGSSSITSQIVQQRRFPLVFIDEHHTFGKTRRDLQFVSSHQELGDLIILDDYTDRFVGVVQAVDEFVEEGAYKISVKDCGSCRKVAVLTRIRLSLQQTYSP